MKKRKQGFFLLEGLMALGIFAIFLSATLPLIKSSIRLKRIAKETIKKHRNHYLIIENMQREVNRSLQLEVVDDGNALKFTLPSYEGEGDVDTIIYKFTSGGFINKLTRKVNYENDEILFYRVQGRFSKEDGFIKMVIDFNLLGEEEYIWK